MKYRAITTDDKFNGEGLRTVLWVSNRGLEFDIYAEAELYSYLYAEHISGVTFSGGDPFNPANRDEVLRLVKDIKERIPGKTAWMYTVYYWEDICDYPGIEYLDVVADWKDASISSSSPRLIDVKKTLETGTITQVTEMANNMKG